MIESFAQMFEESLASQRIRPGQILTGRVIEVGPDVVVVSAGLKSEAVIPTAQFKNGMCIVHEGKRWVIVEFQHVKPGKGGAFVRTKLKELEMNERLQSLIED